MLPLASASCLITDHRQFEVEDYPPSIVPSVSAAIVPNAVKKYSVDDFSNPDGGLSELVIDMVVRDPNVDQDLTVRVLTNKQSGNPRPSFSEEMLPGTGTLTRPYSARVSASELRIPGCNKIEVWVSSSFGGTRTPRSTNPDDIAVMTYWVAVVDSSGSVDMTTCAP